MFWMVTSFSVTCWTDAEPHHWVSGMGYADTLTDSLKDFSPAVVSTTGPCL